MDLRWGGKSLCMSLEGCPSGGWACGQVGDPRSPEESKLFRVRRSRSPGDLGAAALPARGVGTAQDEGPPVGIQSGSRVWDETQLAGVSLKVSREKLWLRAPRVAGCGAGGRLCAPGSRGSVRGCAALLLRTLGGGGRCSSAPPLGRARVFARSSSATGSSAWCGLSGW